MILLVLEAADGCLRFLAHPEWRRIVRPKDLGYFESLLRDFLERAQRHPQDLFKQISSLFVGRADGGWPRSLALGDRGSPQTSTAGNKSPRSRPVPANALMSSNPVVSEWPPIRTELHCRSYFLIADHPPGIL
jgi:hypothetical protein